MSGEDVLMHQHKTWSHIDCNGHCVSGKNRNYLWWTMAAVFILNLHMIRVLIFLYIDLKRFSGLYYLIFYVVALIWAYLFFLEVSSMFFTAFSDPGIIPKVDINERVPVVYDNRKTVKFREGKVVLKYCDTCKIWRPPRTIHCSRCNNCVLEFDHCCPWLGNCIGKRNYRFFIAFIFSTFIQCFVVMFSNAAIIVLDVINQDSETSEIYTFAIHFDNAIAIIATFIFIFCSGNLCCYHSTLLRRGLTTNEDIKEMTAKTNIFRDPNRPVHCQCVSPCRSEPSSFVAVGFDNRTLSDELFMRPLIEQNYF